LKIKAKIFIGFAKLPIEQLKSIWRRRKKKREKTCLFFSSSQRYL